MKKVFVWALSLAFVSSTFIGCGKKFDENVYKGMEAATSALTAAYKTQVEMNAKALEDQTKLAATTTIAPAEAAKFAEMFKSNEATLKKQADLLAKEEAILKDYKDGKTKTEEAQAALAALKAEEDQMMADNKKMDEALNAMRAAYEAAAKAAKPTTAPKGKK